MTTDEFIERMLILFGSPESANDEVFFDEFRSMLRGTHPSILEKAKDIVRDDRTYKGWPTHGEVREAVQKAAYAVKLYTPPEHRALGKDDDRAEPDEASKARVEALKRQCVETLTAHSLPAEKPAKRAVVREDFDGMQRASRNSHLHRRNTTGEAA